MIMKDEEVEEGMSFAIATLVRPFFLSAPKRVTYREIDIDRDRCKR